MEVLGFKIYLLIGLVVKLVEFGYVGALHILEEELWGLLANKLRKEF